MKFLLKIVQGPNAGAEIALVEGVRVTLGSADSCDIVLADPTLAAEACAIEASADSVTLAVPGSEPERLAPLQVRSFGSTALAVGPADSPWGPLVWEAPAGGDAAEGANESARPESAPPKEADAESTAKPADEAAAEPAAAEGSKGKAPRRGSRLGCLIPLLLLLLLAAWLLTRRWMNPTVPPPAYPTTEANPATLVERFGLTVLETNGVVVYRGDFATRAERLAAAAELYEAQPGAALDFADRETLTTAASDLLQAATDSAIVVSDVTNRVAVLSGRAPDPAFLAAALEALRIDVPRLSGADTAAVKVDSPLSAPRPAPLDLRPAAAAPAAPKKAPRIPLRCILLQPYPCLVLQDGQRLLEGADVGGYRISKITFDRIAFRNEAGEELEWTP